MNGGGAFPHGSRRGLEYAARRGGLPRKSRDSPVSPAFGGLAWDSPGSWRVRRSLRRAAAEVQGQSRLARLRRTRLGQSRFMESTPLATAGCCGSPGTVPSRPPSADSLGTVPVHGEYAARYGGLLGTLREICAISLSGLEFCGFHGAMMGRTWPERLSISRYMKGKSTCLAA